MITGTLKQKVDRIWEAFWTNGISNPLTVIEQLSYLLFIKRLDEVETAKERQARRLGEAVKNRRFAPDQQHLRWSRFKDEADPATLFRVVSQEVFPFMKELGASAGGTTGGDGAYAQHMKDAVFMIGSPALLKSVVRQLDELDLTDRDTKGDLYEYMLSKLTTAGRNGQFRTPRHVIKMMVALVAPTPKDTICDPACGTAGFLVAAAEYLREHHRAVEADPKLFAHFHRGMFHGFDFDSTMLRIASMNLMLHGIEDPAVERRDSLAQEHAHVREAFTVVLANPPFKGSLDYEGTAKDLLRVVKTKKTELLFLAQFLRILKTGGRAAVIVPDGVLFGSSTAHQAIRRELVERHKLDGIVSLPPGVFKPYAGVSTAVLLFTKTGAGGTDHVWFYDVQADGLSLDDKREPVAQNDLPDVLETWRARDPQAPNDRTARHFFVPKAEIVANGYDLSINRYKEVVHAEAEYEPPHVILERLRALEAEIARGLDELGGMLG